MQKLKDFGLLRAANIAICLAAILYFLTAFVFAPLLNASVPLIDRAWVYVTTILIVVPQVFLLLLFLLFEIRKTGGIRRHAIVLLLIMATIGVGYVYTTGVTSPVHLDLYPPRVGFFVSENESVA